MRQGTTMWGEFNEKMKKIERRTLQFGIKRSETTNVPE
jgi:hypothetical protein